jgi:toxin HigB-1
MRHPAGGRHTTTRPFPRDSPHLRTASRPASRHLTYDAARHTFGIVIKSFRGADTEALFNRQRVPRFNSIERPALRKLEMLNAATQIRQLTAIPGNRLEALKGNRKGQHSMRINDRWRVCFVWRVGDAYDVEVTDHYQ